jgi:hypothetical protein
MNLIDLYKKGFSSGKEIVMEVEKQTSFWWFFLLFIIESLVLTLVFLVYLKESTANSLTPLTGLDLLQLLLTFFVFFVIIIFFHSLLVWTGTKFVRGVITYAKTFKLQVVLCSPLFLSFFIMTLGYILMNATRSLLSVWVVVFAFIGTLIIGLGASIALYTIYLSFSTLSGTAKVKKINLIWSFFFVIAVYLLILFAYSIIRVMLVGPTAVTDGLNTLN